MDQFGGIIDDARTLLAWRPVLPLLRSWQDERDPVAKLRAALRVGRFVAETVDARPGAFAALDAAERIVDAMAVDPRLREAILGVLR